jgi:leader peptidase (prepilin peptidase) / N-methyltransferase
MWAAAFWHFGTTFDALRVSVFATVLTGIAVTDLRTYTIPDGFTVFGLAFVTLASFVAPFAGDTGLFASPLDALFGACTGAGAIAVAMWLGEWALGREAMGFGDVTLMAVVGAALGPSRSLMTIFLGALLGTVVFLAVVLPLSSRRPRTITGGGDAPGDADTGEESGLPLVPFGVFLAPAALVTLLWGDTLVSWYLAFINR